MDHHHNSIKITLLLFLFSFSQAIFAEIFCVTNSTEFSAALIDAADNSEADHIKMKRGDYPILGGNSFFYTSNGELGSSLKITGGWADFNGGQCNFITLNTSAFDTSIDGLSTNSVLKVQIGGDADFEISAVSFTHGVNGSSNARGGGLDMRTLTGYTGEILIENNAFLANEATYGSAISAGRGNKIIVRNNLIIANHARAGSAVELVNNEQRGIYFTNNTVLVNTTDGDSINTAAVYVAASGTSQAFIANNILWNNELRDLRFFAGTYLYNNDIGIYLGSPIDESHNISAEPEFESAGPGGLSFVPAYNSNLYNQGKEPPTFVPLPIPFESDWDVGVNDTFGIDRVINGQVDIGSFETPPETPIFIDGFES